MRRSLFFLFAFLWLSFAFSVCLRAATLSLKNSSTEAIFNDDGLVSIRDIASDTSVSLSADRWSIRLDAATLRNVDSRPQIKKTDADEITYTYLISGYQVEAVYRLRADWHFVTKQVRILQMPRPQFIVHSIMPLDIELKNPVRSAYIPSTYEPQVGQTISQSRNRLPGKDYGVFLRLGDNRGLMLTVQNPYLDVNREGQSVSIGYAPEMRWESSWGSFASDIACIGAYRLSGERLPREMTLEWKLPPSSELNDGMDNAEIAAFTQCVRAFLIDPTPSPISVEVGWTLNDYQIDVGTAEGIAEYKRIIDTASDLGIRTLLYAPANSKLSERSKSTDSWSWEYVLWLDLGEKIRSGEWNPLSDPVPADIREMVAYAKQKHVGLLAYVYPSLPYSRDASWLVKGNREKYRYASLASRKFQDYLIRNLVAFQQRTGIAGYSFDYTWLNLPGSSSYAQWFGWRRVMETLRKESPQIVIDGRQSYQMYGPWSWLAGSYPHPTGTDEQPESFTPFPDLHFDRVSADRARFVNYWYRNYQFAPTEVVPGYATHQTERSMNVPPDTQTGGHPQEVKMMYTRFRPRDWDYLGFRYSFLSSIATAGWNNVVDMIPARDSEEAKHFSAADKAWIRGWLDWTRQNKELVQHTRSILQPPAIGHIDGTSMIAGDRGYLFLFNPNYRSLPAAFHLDGTIGLEHGKSFLLREIYPQKGRLIGKHGSGVWTHGDEVQLALDGTSATVLELLPASSFTAPVVLNATSETSSAPVARLTGSTLVLTDVAGEPGTQQEIGVLLPTSVPIQKMVVNGTAVQAQQSGRYVSVNLHFAGTRFRQAEQIALFTDTAGRLHGKFSVPQDIFAQLAARKKAWPIPWTPEDYKTTWLAPERLLLFIQIAEPSDTRHLSATLDGQPLTLSRAYSSVRVHSPSFVGFYADLSKIAPERQHSFTLQLPQLRAGQFQGVFFDNVQPRLTEELVQ
jgi:hypothetical protein